MKKNPSPLVPDRPVVEFFAPEYQAALADCLLLIANGTAPERTQAHKKLKNLLDQTKSAASP